MKIFGKMFVDQVLICLDKPFIITTTELSCFIFIAQRW